MVAPDGSFRSGALTLSESLTRRLEELILDGTLKPGRKIPSERQLSERLGVSRNILRESLKALRGRGLIETRHGQGTVVAELVRPPNEQGPITFLYRDHPRVLYDLLEVREILEGRAASLAAERATETDLNRITHAFQSLEEIKSLNTDAQEATLRDHAFHNSIYEASHNPVLVHTLVSLMQPMRQSVLASVSNLYHRPASKKQIDHHHRQIYNAIKQHQPERAEKAAQAHIRFIQQRLQEIDKSEQRLDRSMYWELITST